MAVWCGAVLERFYMLAVFVWASALQAGTWGPIAAAPEAAKSRFPGLTDASILMQLNLGPIVQMLFVPPAMALLGGPRGLQRCVRAGVLLAALSAALRLLATSLPLEVRSAPTARWLLLGAAAACGASGGFLQGAPSRFSAVWFPPEQRARATGCAFVGLGLGQALCYAACLLLTHGADDITNFLLSQAAFAVPPLLCCFVYFPQAPRIAAGWSRSAATVSLVSRVQLSSVPENEVGRGVRGGLVCRASCVAEEDHARPQRLLACAVFRRRSAFLLMIVCSLANGPYQAWCAVLPTILEHLKFSQAQMDMLSLGSILAYTVGCYVAGELGDRAFRGRFKMLIMALLLAALASFSWLCLMLPTHFRPQPLLPSSFLAVLLAVALTGWFTGATNPISVELCAEITHPVPEGVSGNLIILITQVFTVAFLFVVPVLSPLVVTPLTTAILVVCVLLLSSVREQYLRSISEGSLQARA